MSQTQAERLSRAEAARQAGRYAKVLRELEDCEEWSPPENEAATLLRADVLTREAPAKALELLARMQDVMTSKEGRFGYYVASAQAYTATRNYDAAAAMIDLAQTLSDRVTRASRSLLHFHRALLRWCRQEFDPNDADLEALCSGSDPHGNFLGLELRGWMHAGLGRYDSHAQDLTAAVRVATAHPGVCDPEMVARQIHALLRLGLERGDEAATEAGAAAYDALSWSDDMQSERFLCLRALAWTSFLRGDSAQAQWLFKEAKSYAASDAWTVMAHLDRAYVARMNGNEPWAVEEALEAHRIARGVPWSATQGEERQALVMLAVLLAPVDMARAQRYVSSYMQMGKDSVHPMLALAQDRRAVGFEKYALGRVHQVLGNETLAIACFEAAHEVFSETGYRFRAALAATGLYETTGEERWRERARRAASIYPQSALCTTLNAQPCPIDISPLRELAPMERQIALALCEGLSVAQLSRRFSRSAFTINQIVATVYDRLGTRNRANLRARLNGWGGSMILTAVSLFAAAMILAALGTMAVIRRAERQRSFDDRRYALLETLPDALLIVDDRWCFTHVNERAETLLRRGAADLIGKRVDQILDPLASDIFPEMQRVRKTGLPVEFVQTFAYSGLSVEVRVQPSIGEVLVYLRDVTERRNAEKRLREGERRLRLLLQQVPAVVWTADLDMRVTAASGTTLEDFALRESDVVGHSVEAVFGASERARQDAVLDRILQGDSVRFETCRNERWLQHEVEPLRGNDGGIIGAIGAALDISEMKRSARRLAAQARTDALTGLPNRLALEESLDETLARVEAKGECLAVIFLDLDRFKVINDSLGHRAGDVVLREVARRLNRLLANRARVYRPGGDEFVILAAGLTCARAAEAMTAEILDVFAKPFEFEDRELLVTASIGASVYPDNAALAEDLVKQADAAMYRAKDAGRKNVKFYNRAMHAQIIERMGLELDLRQALERREFFVVYQPIVALTSQEIVAAEALLRWEHPTLGLLAPGRFIDIAEEGGAIVEITRWVLEKACEQTVATRKLDLPEFRVAVNVSARDLAEPDFQDCFAEILTRHGLEAGAIDIEVTEGVTMSDRAMNMLELIQRSGTRVIVDDFGIGYSSLDYIRRLPVSVIKIDKSFIADVAHCAHDQAIIKAITTLADSLGIGMIAEGIETSAQREFLMSLGVPVAQGFYFSRPVSPAQFAQLVHVKRDEVDPGSRRVVSLFR